MWCLPFGVHVVWEVLHSHPVSVIVKADPGVEGV